MIYIAGQHRVSADHHRGPPVRRLLQDQGASVLAVLLAVSQRTGAPSLAVHLT